MPDFPLSPASPAFNPRSLDPEFWELVDAWRFAKVLNRDAEPLAWRDMMRCGVRTAAALAMKLAAARAKDGAALDYRPQAAFSLRDVLEWDAERAMKREMGLV